MTYPVRLLLVIALVFIASCARAPLKEASQAMRPVSTPELSDDLPLPTLLDAVAAQIQALEPAPAAKTVVESSNSAKPGGTYGSEGKGDTAVAAPDYAVPAPSAPLTFGPRSIPRAEYVSALRALLEQGRRASDPTVFYQWVKDHFDFMEVYGRDHWGEVLMTSYYEPLIDGSLTRTSHFDQPLYRAPDDLLTLNLMPFDPKYAKDRTLRARRQGKALVPYYSREDIDSRGALKGRNLEIVYVDPIESFFLQVQGSGTVALPDGQKLRVIYAEKNGHPYQSLGNFLKDKIPDGITLQKLEAYLHSLPRAELQRMLNLNASYVFFAPSTQSAVTFAGVPASAGRTIATDPRFFPKGALAFLVAQQPHFVDASASEPDKWVSLKRFVLDQDIGGAITGGGRLDLFWGAGPTAKQYAGVVKQTGTLYYLVPKPNL